jgi:leader peptidase (prepilin peptidase)/N-methyltransferase
MLIPGALLEVSVFALGCVVGSFLNVCIYRMPRDRSVVSPPSHCPQCGGRLRAVDLVPLISFLALGRKCRFCGSGIAWRYFAVELITGLVFLGVWRASGAGLHVVPGWVFASVVIAVVFTDLDHMIIPDKLVVAALAAALLSEGLLVAQGEARLLSVPVPGTALALPRFLAGGLVGLGVFVFIRAFSQLLFRREGMGLGDVKLAGAIGAMLGPTLALVSFGLAIVAGAVLGVLLMVARLRRRMEYLPFGPFLAAAALVALLAPELLIGVTRDLYFRWLEMLAP